MNQKKFSGYKRVTFEFNEGWAGEDEHQYVGEFTVLKHRSVPSVGRSSTNEVGCAEYKIAAPAGVEASVVKDVLSATFVTACRHEHDCCGCVFTRVEDVHRINRRNWFVRVRHMRNV